MLSYPLMFNEESVINPSKNKDTLFLVVHIKSRQKETLRWVSKRNIFLRSTTRNFMTHFFPVFDPSKICGLYRAPSQKSIS